MERPQLIRRVRIAVSVFFAVVTVALCVLWVRSFWRSDHVMWPNNFGRVTHVASASGSWQIARAMPKPFRTGWVPTKLEFWLGMRITPNPTAKTVLSVDWESDVDGWRLSFPQLLLIVMFVSLAATLGGLPMRFSLRTLLIATTLVAVVLGLGVWAAG